MGKKKEEKLKMKLRIREEKRTGLIYNVLLIAVGVVLTALLSIDFSKEE